MSPCEFFSVFLLLIPSSLIAPSVWKLFVVVNAASAGACQHGNLIPDPNSCTNYIQCNHNEEIVRPCPAGLHFNPSSSTCDWPQNVQCGGGGSDGDDESSTAEEGSSGWSSTTWSSAQVQVTTTSWTSTTSAPDGDDEEQTSTSSSKPTTSLPPPPSIPPSGSPSPRFAPYFDVNMDGPSLTQVYSKTGQKDFTLAFALGSSEGCKPKWGGANDITDPGILGPVRELQKLGGHFIVATGGAMGPYFEHLCSSVDELASAYKIVLDAVGTNHIDVDVESTVDNDRVNQALAKVQRERPNTTVSYTLMVQAEDYGLTPILGTELLRNAKKNGVQVAIVNPMTMEFGGPSKDFGDSVIGAAKSVLQQMKGIWPEKGEKVLKRMLGVTPMLGRNFNGKIFTQEHARKLVSWANENQIGLLAFWSVGRDNGGCAGGAISPKCSSIAQGEYEFIKIFQGFK